MAKVFIRLKIDSSFDNKAFLKKLEGLGFEQASVKLNLPDYEINGTFPGTVAEFFEICQKATLDVRSDKIITDYSN